MIIYFLPRNIISSNLQVRTLLFIVELHTGSIATEGIWGECRFKGQVLTAVGPGSMSLTVLLRTLLPHPCRALFHRVCVKAIHKTVYGKQFEHCKALQI